MKRTTRLLALLLAALFMASTFSAAYAVEIAGYVVSDHGDCGNGVKWYFGKAKAGSSPASDTMVIEGKGAMTDYSQISVPQWVKLKEKIMHVVVRDGVTSVGAYAFADCPLLHDVTLADSVRSIGDGAFKNCDNLQKALMR